MTLINPTTRDVPGADRSRPRAFGRGIAALAFAFVSASACGSSDTPVEPTPDPIVVAPAPKSLLLIRGPGQPNTAQLTSTVSGTSNGAVTYTSMTPGIASVTATGFVTGLVDGFTSILVASQADPTKTASVAVNVVSIIVSTSPSALFIPLGGADRQVTATVKYTSNTGVTWSSSNTSIATVSSTGVVSAVAQGTASIIATSVVDPAKSASSSVTIDPAPTGTKLTSGTAVTGIAGATGSDLVYYIVVPAGATSLKVTLAADNGDADIFVKAGRPTDFTLDTKASDWACFSAGGTSNETCTVTNPQQRIYYVTIDAYVGYTNASLTATLTP
jgi:hypothetical protein